MATSQTEHLLTSVVLIPASDVIADRVWQGWEATRPGMAQLGLFPPLPGHGSSVLKQMPRAKFSDAGCGVGSPRIPILEFILYNDEQKPKMVPWI